MRLSRLVRHDHLGGDGDRAGTGLEQADLYDYHGAAHNLNVVLIGVPIMRTYHAVTTDYDGVADSGRRTIHV